MLVITISPVSSISPVKVVKVVKVVNEMVIAADWPSRRPSVAAQEMSGWWSLTSTTKADSAQPAVLGGRSAAPWVEKSSAVEKKHWWCRQVLYTEYHGCLQKVRSRKHIRGLPKVPRLFRVSFPHVSTPSDQQVRAKRHHNRSGRRFGTTSGATCISMSCSTSSLPSRSAQYSGPCSVGPSGR